jgi:hypothetical protein
MKYSTGLLGALLLAVSSAGCTPDFGENGDSPVILRVVSIEAEEGQEEEAGAFLNSDVLPIFNDNVTLTLEALSKNPRITGNLPLQDVLVERYEVRYLRSDGLNTEGVDVPYTISGGLSVLVPMNGEADVALVLVRHQAKFEPPLSNLGGPFGADIVLSVTAEITLHGRTTAGDVVSTRGFVRINFADFAEEE